MLLVKADFTTFPIHQNLGKTYNYFPPDVYFNFSSPDDMIIVGGLGTQGLRVNKSGMLVKVLGTTSIIVLNICINDKGLKIVAKTRSGASHTINVSNTTGVYPVLFSTDSSDPFKSLEFVPRGNEALVIDIEGFFKELSNASSTSQSSVIGRILGIS